MIEESFKNCVCEAIQIGINLPIRFFTLFEENFQICLCETPQVGINLPIYSFNVVKENFRNHLCETTQIGIEFTIHSFTTIEESVKSVFVKCPIFALTLPFTTSQWLKKILKIASVKPLRLASI